MEPAAMAEVKGTIAEPQSVISSLRSGSVVKQMEEFAAIAGSKGPESQHEEKQDLSPPSEIIVCVKVPSSTLLPRFQKSDQNWLEDDTTVHQSRYKEETLLEHSNNLPALRLERCCSAPPVIQNLSYANDSNDDIFFENPFILKRIGTLHTVASETSSSICLEDDLLELSSFSVTTKRFGNSISRGGIPKILLLKKVISSWKQRFSKQRKEKESFSFKIRNNKFYFDVEEQENEPPLDVSRGCFA